MSKVNDVEAEQLHRIKELKQQEQEAIRMEVSKSDPARLKPTTPDSDYKKLKRRFDGLKSSNTVLKKKLAVVRVERCRKCREYYDYRDGMQGFCYSCARDKGKKKQKKIYSLIENTCFDCGKIITTLQQLNKELKRQDKE